MLLSQICSSAIDVAVGVVVVVCFNIGFMFWFYLYIYAYSASFFSPFFKVVFCFCLGEFFFCFGKCIGLQLYLEIR